MVLRKVMSGGQSGADLGGWAAAKAAGLETGGWMPPQFMTEDGPRPSYADEYGAAENPEGRGAAQQYRLRATANVRDSDATICFDARGSAASLNAAEDARRFRRPFRCVILRDLGGGRIVASLVAHTREEVADWIENEGVAVLNVAGNRESKAAGMGAFVEGYLADVFAILRARAMRS